MTLSRSLALLLPLALLAGCHKAARNDERSASGQVLQGTISDAMLPLDKLKSQGPLLAPTEEKSTPEGLADKQSGGAAVTSVTSESSVLSDVEATPTPGPTLAPSASAAP